MFIESKEFLKLISCYHIDKIYINGEEQEHKRFYYFWLTRIELIDVKLLSVNNKNFLKKGYYPKRVILEASYNISNVYFHIRAEYTKKDKKLTYER